MAHPLSTFQRVLPTVLVVDDGMVDRHKAGGIIRQSLGWDVAYAADGAEALAIIGQDRPSLVLTDLQMPNVDGLELVEAIRARYPFLPVVLMTAHGSEDTAVRALQLGAASYVPKRELGAELPTILTMVLSVAEEGQRQRNLLLNCLVSSETTYLLGNDPSLIRDLVNHFQTILVQHGIIPETRRLNTGVALEEALTNALYHGNLELSSDLRQSGDINAYHTAAQQRMQERPYSDRQIHVRLVMTAQDATITVRDEGKGFDPASLPDPTDPENMIKASGRGLLLIQTFMDEVHFNSTGNEITMRLHKHKPANGSNGPHS